MLRTYAVACLEGPDGPQQEALYREISAHEDSDVVDHADRIRAKALWSAGQSSRALGVALDLVARRPELNPVLGFLADRIWQVDRPCGDEVLALLAKAPDTGTLALGEMGITDLSPIAGRRAWMVMIQGNAITDLSPLQRSGSLRIEAGRNAISDLSPLRGMSGLTGLYIGDNAISDLRPLAGMTQLRNLTVSRNEIASLAGLPPGIQELVVGTYVEGSDSLRQLNPSEPRPGGNPVADLAGLPLGELRYLAIAETRIADLSLLAGASRLTRLDLSATPVRDLTPLRGLPIEDLHLARCSEVDLATLDLPALRRLDIRELKAADPIALARLLPRLNTLFAQGSGLRDWPDVVAPELKELTLSGCQLSGITGLRLASGLRSLMLRGCGLRQIDPVLADLPLERLDLRGNALTDLGELATRPPTQMLVVGNPLDDTTCESLIASGRRLGRPDLVWQAASIQAHRRGDLEPLRRQAKLLDGRLLAVYFPPELIDAETAKGLAEASGGRLAVPLSASANNTLSKAAIFDRPLWLGLQLHDGRVTDDDGAVPRFIAQIPAARYRGYSALPRDAGRIGLAAEGNWALCLDGKSSGMVVEWDPVW